MTQDSASILITMGMIAIFLLWVVAMLAIFLLDDDEEW